MSYGPNQMYPGATELDPNYPKDKFKDNNPSTTNNGTPLKAIKENQDLTLETAVMNDAGFEYSGVADTPQDSQLFKAYKASLGNGVNLLSNHNFLIQTPDDSQPLPSATPTSYPPGYQIFSGVFANETTGITNLTYIDGRVSFSGGDLYFSVPNTGAVARLTADQLTASVADFDGKPRTRGVSFALVGDEYRVTVGVDALEDVSSTLTLLGSVKLEQGGVATGHEVDSGVIALGTSISRLLESRFSDAINIRDIASPNTPDSLADALESLPDKSVVIIPASTWEDRFILDRKVDVNVSLLGLGSRINDILSVDESDKYSYIQVLSGGGFSGGSGANDRREVNSENVMFVGESATPSSFRTATPSGAIFDGTFDAKFTRNGFIALEYGENNDRAFFNEYRFNIFGNCTYPLMLDDTNSTTWSGNFFVACVHGIVGAPVSESCYLEDNKFNITNETISCINIGGGVEFGGSTYLENFSTIANPRGLVPIVYRPTSGDRWASIGNVYVNAGASSTMVNVALFSSPASSIRTRIDIGNIYKSGDTSGKAIQFGANTFDDSGLDSRLLRNGNGALQLVDLDLASTNLEPDDIGNFYISNKPITKGLIQNGSIGRLELQAGNVIDKGAQFQTYSDRLEAFRGGEFVLKLNLVLSSSAGGTLRLRPTVSGSIIETVSQDVAASGSQTLSYELPAIFTAGQTIYFDTAVASGDVTIESGSYSFEFIDEGLKSDPF